MKIRIIFKKLIKKLKTSHFIKNITVVMSGTALAQALGFALSPVISRLYTPSDFGIFGSFNSLVSIITATVTLEYSQALILPKKKNDAFYLFIFSCICSSSTTVLFSFIYLAAPEYFKSILQTDSSWIFIPLLTCILVTGLNQTFQAWCVRVKAFKDTSVSQVIRSLSSNGMQTGLGFLKGGAPALIYSSVVADFFATVNLARVTLADFRKISIKFSLKKMLEIAKEYRDFPLYSASLNIINALSLGLPVFLLTHYYGVSIAGGYAFAMRILSVPMQFVLRALRQVLYQKATETYNEGRKLAPLYIKITGGLFGLAVVPSLVFIIWAPQIFGLVFSTKWIFAGEFARALVIWLMFMFCNLPATLFARIIRVQQKMFLYDITLLVLRTAALVVGGKFLSPEWTIMIFAIVGAIMNVIFIVIIGFLLAKKEKVSGLNDLITIIREDS